MARINYSHKRGSGTRMVPDDQVADEMEKLYRRRIEATALTDDASRVIGRVEHLSFPEYNLQTNRPFRWTWWAEA